MNIELHLKSKGKYKYDSKAIYRDGHIVVLKGSIINSALANSDKFSVSKQINKIRNDRSIVSKDMVVLKDIEFSSPTKAGIFVCGYSVNGLDRWKNADRKKLKDLLTGGKYE